MKRATYNTPHLFGTVDYAGAKRLRPDGDTFHLRDPVLLLAGRTYKPSRGAIEVLMPGQTRPRRLELTDADPPYLTIRLSGLDAPEAHYVAPVRPEPSQPAYVPRPGKHAEVCQPGWRHAARFLLGTLGRAVHALVEIDRDVVDQRGRVLGFVYTANAAAEKKRFLSLELLRRGLAFPFVFESAADHRKRFLAAGAAARRERLGVWRRYRDRALDYDDAAHDTPSPYDFMGDDGGGEPSAWVNHPMIFRRVVEAGQLRGVRLAKALRKYDVFDDESGRIVTGDRYEEIAVERRVWARHRG